MTFRYYLYLSFILATLLFMMPAYAGGTHEGRLKPISNTGNLIVSLDTRPNPIALGDNEVFLTVLGPNKKYANIKTISVTASMPGMKMKTDNDSVTLTPEGKMRFRGIIKTVTMGGTWHINVTIEHDGVRDAVIFEEKVKWEF